jgi:hypothetical protein
MSNEENKKIKNAVGMREALRTYGCASTVQVFCVSIAINGNV